MIEKLGAIDWPNGDPNCRISTAICLLLFFGCPGQPLLSRAEEKTDPSVESDIAGLKNPDPLMRATAVRNLQTSLDPRIPDAVLPLLMDEGTSTRRLAARAIGSRWWQISKDNTPAFLVTLQRNERSKNRGVKNMTDRALGLLQRDYRSNMFARSASRRWVVYERRKLPCLIDTKSESEELLGWTPDHDGKLFRPWLFSAVGSAPLEKSVLWHPRKDTVAFYMVSAGRPRPLGVWLWQHESGLRKLNFEEVVRKLESRDEGAEQDKLVAGFELRAWKSDELQFSLNIAAKDDFLVGWDVSKNTLRVISRTPLDSSDDP